MWKLEKFLLNNIESVPLSSKFLDWLYFPRVDSCLSKLCAENEDCTEEDGLAKCICQRCDGKKKAEQVCGSDGITYYSLCHLQQASCIQKMDIQAQHYGPCGKPKPLINYSGSASGPPRLQNVAFLISYKMV